MNHLLEQSQYREVMQHKVIAGFNVTEAVYAPSLRVTKHAHRNACFGLVLEGSYFENYGTKSLECKPLQVKFRPAQEVHANKYGDPSVRCFFIEPPTQWMFDLANRSVRLAEPTVIQSHWLICLLMRIRKESRQIDAVSQLAIEGLMLEVAAEVTRGGVGYADRSAPAWMKQVREILHDRFCERLTLSDVGKTVGIHPVHLAGVFRRRYQCSVGEYVRRLRIEFACREMATTRASLAQIAAAAGFADQSQFSRTFKRQTGLTPGQYRSSTLN